MDVIKIRPPELQLSASSLKGKFVLEQSSASWHDWELLHPRELTSEEVSKDTYLSAERMEEHYSRLNVKFSHFQTMSTYSYQSPGDYYYLVVPQYYPVALTALVAGIVWIPWSLKFSLRTLLIFTTLFAGALGLYVYLRP